MNSCTCFVTDPETWFRYGDATEPGSQLEPNPDCLVHFRVHVIYRTSRGYCTEPCAECGTLISDAKPYIILEKDWLPRHVVCFQCPTCSDVHLPPYDGSCLL